MPTNLEHVLREFRKTGSRPDLSRRRDEQARGRLSGTRRFQLRLIILAEHFMSFSFSLVLSLDSVNFLLRREAVKLSILDVV